MLTEEQIKEYNYLIAKSKLSGLIECDLEYQMKWCGIKDVDRFNRFKERNPDLNPLFYSPKDISLPYFEDSFKYHESLDSLLPIIEKIVDNGCIFEFVYNLNTYCRICVVNGKNNKAFNIEYQNETNALSVEPIYLAIVDYLKYINSKEE